MSDDLLIRLDQSGDPLAKRAAARIRQLSAQYTAADLERAMLQDRINDFYRVVTR